MTTNNDTELLTQAHVSRDYFDGEVSESTLEKWRSTGRGPKFVKAGRAVFYRRADVEAWLTRRTRSHTRETAADLSPHRRR